eukprot:jgi/Botrbrau1/5236/Bobra.0172s0098.1
MLYCRSMFANSASLGLHYLLGATTLKVWLYKKAVAAPFLYTTAAAALVVRQWAGQLAGCGRLVFGARG